MMTMNKATLLGYAGRDPEMRKLPSGDDVAEFSLATNGRFRRRDDTVGESTEWHSIVAFGPAAEAVRKLVRKGLPVLVEGRIVTRCWTDRTGTERRTTEIVVAGRRSLVNVLARRRTGAGGDGGDGDPPGGPAASGAASGAGPAEGAEAANGASQTVSAGAAGSPSDEAAAAESEGTGEIAASGDEVGAGAGELGADPPVGDGDNAGASAVGGAGGEAAGLSEDAAAAGAESDGTGEIATAGGGEEPGEGDASVEAAMPANADAGTAGPSDDDDHD